VSTEPQQTSSALSAAQQALQERGRKTRERLCVAGYELFARKGYEGTSIGDVAAMAGVGVGTVYHHFADKRALLLEVLETYEAGGLSGEGDEVGLLGEAFAAEDVRAAIQDAVRLAVELSRRHPSLHPTAKELGRRDPEVAACCSRIEAAHAGRLRRALELGQRLGKVRAALDPAACALVLQAVAQAVIPRIAEESPSDSEAPIRGLVELLSGSLLTA